MYEYGKLQIADPVAKVLGAAETSDDETETLVDRHVTKRVEQIIPNGSNDLCIGDSTGSAVPGSDFGTVRCLRERYNRFQPCESCLVNKRWFNI